MKKALVMNPEQRAQFIEDMNLLLVLRASLKNFYVYAGKKKELYEQEFKIASSDLTFFSSASEYVKKAILESKPDFLLKTSKYITACKLRVENISSLLSKCEELERKTRVLFKNILRMKKAIEDSSREDLIKYNALIGSGAADVLNDTNSIDAFISANLSDSYAAPIRLFTAALGLLIQLCRSISSAELQLTH